MKYLLLILTFLCTCGPAQAQTHEGLFIFGHSLIDHRPPLIPTPSNETTVPHWLYLLANEAGNSVAAGGQYGFLPQHANVPPISQWGYDLVPGVWESDTEPFSSADVSTVIITAGNFVQYQPPNEEYFGDPGVTPINATETVFDWVEAQKPGTKYYIYENWPDMAGFLANGFPPTSTEFDSYQQETLGDFHDWWITYHDALLTSRPDLNVRMIPVGPIIAKIIDGPLADQIPVTDFYEDDAPHGRPNLYFLAALITYAAIFEEQAPATYTPPDLIHPDLRNNYAAINAFIWNELHAFDTPAGDSRVFMGGALPFTLASFTAELNGGDVVLSWSTSLEENIDKFQVEQLVPTGNFLPLGLSVTANNAPSDYSFTDENPFDGENVYRLAIFDTDGGISYSSLATITIAPNSVRLLPTGDGTFRLQDAPRGTEYYFTDATGRLLKRGRIEHPGELLELAGNRFAGIGFLVATLPGQVPLHFRFFLTR